MPITFLILQKTIVKLSFSYNLISVVRAGKPESFFIVIFIKVSFLAFKNEE